MFDKTVTQDKHIKTLAKTITYRVISSVVTVFLTLILGGNITQALTMGTIVMCIAMIHYYLYDRLWMFIAWQRNTRGEDSQVRSLVKSVIYRITAIVVTAAIARMVFADTNLVALILASIKFVVNLIAYYALERIFNSISWGRRAINT